MKSYIKRTTFESIDVDRFNVKVWDGSSWQPINYKASVYNGAEWKKMNGSDLIFRFGALSDTHIQYNTGEEDFANACNYLKEQGADFAIMCGDLTSNGTDEELAQYASYVSTYAQGLPIYAVSGNHEGYRSGVEERIEAYTGHPLYYSFMVGDDIFIAMGTRANSEGSLFNAEQVFWLHNLLEQNRNKRAFVFFHVRPQDACGNVNNIYTMDIWGGVEADFVERYLKHYKNAVLFHGHSHLKLELAERYGTSANIDTIFGRASIHVPSLTVPRDGGQLDTSAGRRELYAKSEGYLVDVYPNKIVLHGFELADYDSANTGFNAGDYTRHNGDLYKALVDIPAHETWNPAHWSRSTSEFIAEYEIDTTPTEIPAWEVPYVTTDAEFRNVSNWQIGSIMTSGYYQDYDNPNNFRSPYVKLESGKTYTLQYRPTDFGFNGNRVYFYDTLGHGIGTVNAGGGTVINNIMPTGTAYWRIRPYGGENNEGLQYVGAYGFTIT